MNPGGREVLVASALAFGLLTAASAASRPILVAYNATASAPRGWYRITPLDVPASGQLVLTRLPRAPEALADARRYLPAGVPLIKPVAAGPGARVCRLGARVAIDGRLAARARLRDRAGRPLPVWRGCRRLGEGEVFLLSDRPDSFDGRYFGPTPTGLILGEARPLWTW
ncbi:MAG: S26 family signal peptidase [Phenylobacterium sp.]|uniref:S26 family signal peptidase n=1 Tax=Phenylobacterium sp. TaxID=1871053 RepID=UPI0027360179|nr:S26 family signal peptidase [Phenylobacterium sp.]MDP3746656.1 S26 family signal peptidase [Phenylobacterium sp.]